MNKILTLLLLLIVIITKGQMNDPSAFRPQAGGKLEQATRLGQQALYLDRGFAFLPGTNAAEGTIEADVSSDLMAGLAIHVNEGNSDFEGVYLRFPKSGSPDAIQYTPFYKGEMNWAMFPEYQASQQYPANSWVHLKVVFNKTSAAVFVDNSATPQLTIDSLRTGLAGGSIGVWALGGIYFRNLTLGPPQPSALAELERKLKPNKDAILAWDVLTRTFAGDSILLLKPGAISSGKWMRANTDADGLLTLTKHLSKKIAGRTRNNSNDLAWIRYEWNEDRDNEKQLSFDFTNKCIIYLNGAKLYYGSNSFLQKSALYHGELDKKLSSDALFLRVKRGRNTLLVGVASVTNGWGFIAQIKD